MTDILILYEDKNLIVIDKPFGIVVNRAQSVKDQTVQDWVEEKFKIKNYNLVGGLVKIKSEKSDDFLNRSGIVHRLDKETSGCLIIAKDPNVFLGLQRAFKERLVHKTYVALIHGVLVPDAGEICAPVGRLSWSRQRYGIVPGGKDALTKFKRKQMFTSNINKRTKQFTLVELYPETGRTHQIRVHLKYLGFPIVGDYLYAGRKQQREDRVWCPRVFLHATQISFQHPVTKQELTLTSQLPRELKQVLHSLIQV